MRRVEGILKVIAIITGLVAVAAPARAEEERLPDRLMLRLGGYTVRNADVIVRLAAHDLPVGAYIDFHETLGGETKASVVRVDGLYRFNERHGLMLSTYALRFKGSKVLGEDIEWNGQLYPISTQVDSEIKFDVYKMSYQYSLFHTEEAELGATFGLHVMKVAVSLVAHDISQSGSQAVTAPLPVFGLSADYNFTPRLSGYYNYQLFFINYHDKVKGGLQDFLLGLEYRLFRNVALGAAYNRFGLHGKAKGDRSTLYLDTNWNGGMLYGAVYF